MDTVRSMNKQGLVEEISRRALCSQVAAEAMVEAFAAALEAALLRGEDLTLKGFGTFELSVRKARRGHNPHTGKTVKLPELKLVKFRAGKDLKARLNK
jgi:DNA-binding protein HU-beta